MLQQDEPGDYVIATDCDHSVRDCVEIAFDEAGSTGRLRRDRSRARPPRRGRHLIGDPSKAERELGWEPRTSFEELIRLMIESDLELLGR